MAPLGLKERLDMNDAVTEGTWEHARVAIKEAHDYCHYGSNEEATEDALRYAIQALADLYNLLKPPSANELFH